MKLYEILSAKSSVVNILLAFFFGFRQEQAAFSSHVSQQILDVKTQRERCINFQCCQTLDQGKMRDVAESVSRSTDALLALPHYRELNRIGGVLPQKANWVCS